MKQALSSAPPAVRLWLAAIFLVITQWANADDYLVELRLEPSDIADVSIGDEIVITLATAATERLKTLTGDSAGKILRILFRSLIVQEMNIEGTMESGVIAVPEPSASLKDAMACWKKGCPTGDDDDDDDEDCD